VSRDTACLNRPHIPSLLTASSAIHPTCNYLCPFWVPCSPCSTSTSSGSLRNPLSIPDTRYVKICAIRGTTFTSRASSSSRCIPGRLSQPHPHPYPPPRHPRASVAAPCGLPELRLLRFSSHVKPHFREPMPDRVNASLMYPVFSGVYLELFAGVLGYGVRWEHQDSASYYPLWN
jgi:hypothetical protein